MGTNNLLFGLLQIFKEKESLGMSAPNSSILIVDSYGGKAGLFAEVSKMANLLPTIQPTPKSALKTFHEDSPYSIVWSSDNFDLENPGYHDGLSFLKRVQEVSPTSSRILSSLDLFSKRQCKKLVNEGQIHSYVVGPFIHSVSYIESALKVGIEYHKLNVAGAWLDCLGQCLLHDLRKANRSMEGLASRLQTSLPTEDFWANTDNRKLERENLYSHTRYIAEQTVNTINRLVQTKQSIRGSDKKQNEIDRSLVNSVTDRLFKLDLHLVASSEVLAKSLRVAEENISRIQETRKKIQELKEKLYDEES